MLQNVSKAFASLLKALRAVVKCPVNCSIAHLLNSCLIKCLGCIYTFTYLHIVQYVRKDLVCIRISCNHFYVQVQYMHEISSSVIMNAKEYQENVTCCTKVWIAGIYVNLNVQHTTLGIQNCSSELLRHASFIFSLYLSSACIRSSVVLQCILWDIVLCQTRLLACEMLWKHGLNRTVSTLSMPYPV